MGMYTNELYNRIKNDKECIVQPDGSFSGLHVRADLSADVDFKIGDIQTNIVIDFIDSEGVRQLRVRYYNQCNFRR